MKPRIVTVKVGGETHSIDLDETLRIHNADAERHEVAATMAWWGTIAAAAEAQVARLAAAAASWHADALTKCLAADEKMSEWKAKAAASGHSDYAAMAQGIANAQEQAGKAQTVHWALVRKMDMLKEMIKGDNGDKRGAGEIGHVPAGPTEPDKRLSGYKQARGKTAATKED
jgi:hypothetical protein